MPRKSRTSTFDDVIAIAATMPWWVGIALAITSYLVLHHFAALPVPQAPSTLDGMTDAVKATMIRTVCTFLQYLLPLALVIGAAVSAYRRSRSQKLIVSAREAGPETALSTFSWQEFEHIVAEAFREKGFTVFARGGAGPDGGVDIELKQGADKYLVQCKHWKAQAVGVATVRELFGVMTAEGAVGGFVVTAGRFTEDAKRFAEGRSIELIDARKLIQRSPVPAGVAKDSTAVPACPKCGKAMVRRTSRRGGVAGEPFWGCTGYPSCRGTRPASIASAGQA